VRRAQQSGGQPFQELALGEKLDKNTGMKPLRECPYNALRNICGEFGGHHGESQAGDNVICG